MIALSAALSELTSVNTLWVSDSDRYPRPAEVVDEPYALVGPGPPPAWLLPSLDTLNIAYGNGMFRDWWKRLAIALVARHCAGVPFTTLRIYHNWGAGNIHRPVAAARTPLETFHEQSGVDLRAPDVFVEKASWEACKHC